MPEMLNLNSDLVLTLVPMDYMLKEVNVFLVEENVPFVVVL